MNDLRAAAQQALEALEALDAPPSGVVDHYELDRRKQALRTALAQQEREPVAKFLDNQTHPLYDQDALDAAVAAERERWKALRDRIQADLDRPEGRWGMHGHSAVDDDYFVALEWVLERMDEVLGPNARLTAPDTAQRSNDER